MDLIEHNLDTVWAHALLVDLGGGWRGNANIVYKLISYFRR